MNIPWMKFYPSDWRADPALRMCSIAARGLWMEMLCIMHEAKPRGSLLINGRQVNERQLAVLAGIGADDTRVLLMELEEAGVFSRAEDGTIYSRRMRRDDEKDAQDRANGRKGGNPAIARGVKGGANPPVKGGDKAQKLEARDQKPDSPPSLRGGGAPEEETALRASISKAFETVGSKPPTTERASVWLAQGYSPCVILAVIKDCLAKNKSIRSLNYFDKAIAEAHERQCGQATEPERPPDPDQVRRGQMIKARRFFEGDWPDSWPGRPGAPDCDIPDDVLIDAAQECGAIWPPLVHAA